MSHRPKVPSTLKLLEGIEVSLLLSLEFFHFLFLYRNQVSQFQKGPRKALLAPDCTYTLCVLAAGAMLMLQATVLVGGPAMPSRCPH